jgi:hypothetical protein
MRIEKRGVRAKGRAGVPAGEMPVTAWPLTCSRMLPSASLSRTAEEAEEAEDAEDADHATVAPAVLMCA